MEMGTFQRVVEYFVVQKITKPVTDHYFHNPRHKNFMESNKTIINYRKEKCPSGLVERWLPSNELFIAHKDPKSECNFTKDL
jgi:hypothetical protein